MKVLKFRNYTYTRVAYKNNINMKFRIITLTTICFLLVTNVFGQDKEKYTQLVKEAEALFKTKEYEQSAEKYLDAFEQLDGKAYSTDRYNAACAFALADDSESAFYHLFYLAENPEIKYHHYWHIATDIDLDKLHGSQDWDKLMTTVRNNKNEVEGVENIKLASILDTVMLTDQRVRREYKQAIELYGYDSPEFKEKVDQVLRTDSLNMVTVGKILEEYGWPSTETVGETGSKAIFLTIQHAKLDTQLKYLPVVKKAVKEGKLEGGALAMMEDRVMLAQGKKQIYGSQIGRDSITGERYVSPMKEPEKVNERRSAVGLGPIEEYVKKYGIIWDPEKHRARVEEMEASDTESH